MHTLFMDFSANNCRIFGFVNSHGEIEVKHTYAGTELTHLCFTFKNPLKGVHHILTWVERYKNHAGDTITLQATLFKEYISDLEKR